MTMKANSDIQSKRIGFEVNEEEHGPVVQHGDLGGGDNGLESPPDFKVPAPMHKVI